MWNRFGYALQQASIDNSARLQITKTLHRPKMIDVYKLAAVAAMVGFKPDDYERIVKGELELDVSFTDGD